MNYTKLTNYANEKYKYFTVNKIATTLLGRNIYKWSCIFDSTRPFVLLQGAVHAREFITTDILIEFIKLIEKDYENLKDIGTPNIIIIPMVNPDGVELVKYGLKSVPQRYHNSLLKMNKYSRDFSLFKANINGVDINNNFDAKWERQKGENKPSIYGYKGKSFNSEIETQTLINETKLCSAIFTMSFHAKGEEIYYNFYQKGYRKKRDRKIAKIISISTGYRIKNVEKVSSGGYKDWCIENLKVPAITIEVGDDSLKHPLREKYAKNIFYKVKDICYNLCDIVKIIGEYDGRKIYGNCAGGGN